MSRMTCPGSIRRDLVSSPSETQQQSRWFSIPVSGTVLDGTYETTVTIPQYSEVGMWTVSEVTLTDAVGNQVSWNTTELDALGFDTEIEVLSGTAGTESELKAVLADLSSNPNGPHLVRLTDDITLTSGQAVYSGTQDLTIDGDGHSVSGNNNSRVFYFPIPDGVTVTLQNIIVEDGATSGRGGYGGGIAVNAEDAVGGDLVVIDSVVRNNFAAEEGRRWHRRRHGGDLTLIDSMVIDNVGGDDIGGVHGDSCRGHTFDHREQQHRRNGWRDLRRIGQTWSIRP